MATNLRAWRLQVRHCDKFLVLAAVLFVNALTVAQADPRIWPVNRNAVAAAREKPFARPYADPTYNHASDSPELKITRMANGAATIEMPGFTWADNVDLFASNHLRTNSQGVILTDWVWLGCTKYGETNLLVTNLWTDARFFKMGSMLDSDNDGLPDTFEVLVSRSNPFKYSTAGNGTADGDQMGPNQLPWRWEQVRYNDAFVYTDIPRAFEGGACGRFMVYLPEPAPPGGTTVQYYFGGLAMRDEYTTTPVGNALHIPAGLVSGSIDVCAVDNREYADLDRYVQLTITNVTGYTFDSHGATIVLIDNDLPDIRVFAFPPRLARPDPREGTNNGTFFFIRDGDSVAACTIGFSITGTAQSGVDYSPLPNTMTFLPNERTNSLPLALKFSRDQTEKTVILTITNTPKYQIDPSSGRATIILETLH